MARSEDDAANDSHNNVSGLLVLRRPLPRDCWTPTRALALVVVVVLVLVADSVTATPPPQPQDDVTCVTEDGSSQTLRADQVNDDYCDCPWTGADEPNTAACAGSLHWPGYQTSDDDKDEPMYVPLHTTSKS